MDKTTAKKLIDLLKELDDPINNAIDVANTIQNEDERRNVKKKLARLFGTIYIELMIPICKDHPELLPDSQAKNE